MQEGQKPIGVGFFFSLGHSTVVVLLCAALALSTAYVERHLPQWKNIGGVAGTIISGCFLYLIGIINLIVMIDLFKAFKRVANGENYDDLDVDQYLANRGLIGRFFRPLFRMVSKSWHMYLIGFLFGLGFDTATEVGILAVSAHGGQVGMSFWTIMLLAGAVHGGDVPGGHERRNTHAGRLRLGVYQAHPQALLQLVHYAVVGAGGVRSRHLRAAPDCAGSIQFDGWFLESGRPPQLRQLGFCDHRHICGWLAGLDAGLQVEEVRDGRGRSR